MLFNSLVFGAFFLVVFAAHAGTTGRLRTVLLLVASVVFYAAWDWRFLGLIFTSVVIDFVAGLRIHRAPDPRIRRRWLYVSLVANLGLLGFFKYFGFFAENLAALLALAGVTVDIGVLPIVLPIVLPVGISFYTFQTLSYTIDVYRGELEPTNDFIDFALFVTFFPQLVAGPIERARALLPQIRAERRVVLDQVLDGTRLIAWGLFKKVFIADNLARAIVEPAYFTRFDGTGLSIWIATYAFAFQIYCDFSGYTDVARGCAKCLGFELMENFRLPYFARNPREFWSRWHISLSTWLRDYLYVPLGGNRVGRTARNLLVTMVLGGLWHGAAWTFVVWGIYQGLLLVLHRMVLERRAPTRRDGPLRHALHVFAFFQLVCLGWMIFRANDFAHLVVLLEKMGTAPWLDRHVGGMLAALLFYTAPLLLVECLQSIRKSMVIAPSFHPLLRGTFYTGCFWLFIVFGEFGGDEYIYFQF